MKNQTWLSKMSVVLIMIILVFSIVTIEIMTLQSTTNNDLIQSAIINSKKQLIKGHVDNVVSVIHESEKNTLKHCVNHAKLYANELNNWLTFYQDEQMTGEHIEVAVAQMKKSPIDEDIATYGGFHVIVYDNEKKNIIYTDQAFEGLDEAINYSELAQVYTSFELDGMTVAVYMTEEEVEQRVKDKVGDWVRTLRVEGSDYLWINEVINYDGGQDYAIRLVHPNLPETEGIFLSTETEDIKENKPYLEELEGVKANGSVYFTYFFKEFESEVISEKLSYARLYEPFDWIIVTGIYMEDIEELQLAAEESQNRIMAIRITIFMTLLVLVVLIIYAGYTAYKINKDLGIEKRESLKENQEMSEKMDVIKTMAYRDSLTDLLNRRGIIEQLDTELSRFRRQSYDLLVIMMDIDHFKGINDDFGHDIGDQTLIHVANILRKSVRNEDAIGRLGGDEFLLIMPYATLQNAQAFGKDFSRRMNKAGIKSGDREICVTLSIGITKVVIDDTVDTVIKRADMAMYQSKRAGRNKISIYNQPIQMTEED